MKTSTALRSFLAGAALSLGLASSVQAMPPRPGGPEAQGPAMSERFAERGQRQMARLHDQLKLDTGQEALWKQAETASKESMTGQRERMKKHHEELRSLMDKPGADLRQAARKIDDFRAEGQQRHQANRDRWLAVYDTLNPEQKEKAHRFFKGMLERMGKMDARDRMGHHGHAGGRDEMTRRGSVPEARK